MTAIHTAPDTQTKLEILASDARFDLSCACASNAQDHRKKALDGAWIYPTTMADGRRTYLFRTLLSNHCANDCKYCPLRRNQDPARCTLNPLETAKTFMDYWRAHKVGGLFLSSGLFMAPDSTMEKLNTTVRLVRRMGFRGYVHLKVMPGASDAAIEDAISLSTAVSINIEAPGEKRFAQLSQSKKYLDDVIRPMKKIAELIQENKPYRRIKQTTQFIVGAADETDAEIVKYTAACYDRLSMHRVYFSAYQPTSEIPLLDPEGQAEIQKRAWREHRLYQVDFLLRKYGFTEQDILFGGDDNLGIADDPKKLWAAAHPEFFPVNINAASKEDLLKVPGFGPAAVKRILTARKEGATIRQLEDLGRVNKTLRQAESFIRF